MTEQDLTERKLKAFDEIEALLARCTHEEPYITNTFLRIKEKIDIVSDAIIGNQNPSH